MRGTHFTFFLVLIPVLTLVFVYTISTRYPSMPRPRSTLPLTLTLPFADKCRSLFNWAILNPLTDSSCETAVLVPENWCLLVVGSAEGIAAQNDRIIYLSVSTMKLLPFTLVSLTRWDSNTDLTNLGYLYAIKRGALVIFEMDKISLSGFSNASLPSTLNELGDYDKAMLEQDHDPNTGWPSGYLHWGTTWSSYHYFGVTNMVPRGYPSSNSIHKGKGVNSLKLHCYPIVKQFVLSNYMDSNHATDVKDEAAFEGSRSVVVPQAILSPYNGRSTMYFHEAFWSLLLPKTAVHHKLSDIWRSYIAQSLFYTIPDSCLMFSSSNEHPVSCSIQNQPADYNLTSLQKLTDTLFYPPLQFESILEGFLKTYLHLLNLGLIEREDIRYVQAWNSDLTDIGYKTPNLPNKSIMWTNNIVLCVMFNTQPSVQVLHTLLAYYMRFFTHISMFVDGKWPSEELRFTPKTVQLADCPSTDNEAEQHRKKRPGGFNHRCLSKCLDQEINEQKIQGFLYIADDVLINFTAAERMPRDMAWMPKQQKYQNKSEAYPQWVIWRKSCGYNALHKVYNALPNEWKDDLRKHELFPAVAKVPIDILFIPTSKASKVAQVLAFILRTTDLFVEIAIPLAVDIAVPPNEVLNLPLEANLDDRRTDVKFVHETVQNYSFVHPVKISQWQLGQLWKSVMSDSLKYYVSQTT